jgi:hypothetical protein
MRGSRRSPPPLLELTFAVPALKTKRFDDVPAEAHSSGLHTEFHSSSFRISVTNEEATTIRQTA